MIQRASNPRRFNRGDCMALRRAVGDCVGGCVGCIIEFTLSVEGPSFDRIPGPTSLDQRIDRMRQSKLPAEFTISCCNQPTNSSASRCHTCVSQQCYLTAAPDAVLRNAINSLHLNVPRRCDVPTFGAPVNSRQCRMHCAARRPIATSTLGNNLP